MRRHVEPEHPHHVRKPESRFRTGTDRFVSQHVLSGYRLNRSALQAGRQHLYLTEDMVGGQALVALDASPSLRRRIASSPIPVWWVPQGGACDIPARPADGDPRFVFTPDFSGCSLLVDQIDAATYRVFHVQGGAAASWREYQGREHGLGLARFAVFDDYGDGEQPRAFVCMRHDPDLGRWMILSQGQTGGLGIGTGADGRLVTADTLRVRNLRSMAVSDLATGPADRDASGARRHPAVGRLNRAGRRVAAAFPSC